MLLNLVLFVVAVAIILLILKIIGKSVKTLIGVLVNALIGFIVLYVLQLVGMPVTVDWLSALIVGILGIPGLVIVLILQLGLNIHF